MTASRWPMRWQRSSAWSCIAGVHSSSRNATFEARVSVMPWPATRVAQTISCGPSGSWKARTAASRAGERVAAEEVQRVGEALEHRLLDLDVAGEDDERLARGEEVVDPRQRGVQLAARGEPLQRAELGQALGAQRRGDLRVELGQVERLRRAATRSRRPRRAGTRARCRARPARRPGAWPAAGAGPRSSAAARSSGGAGASAGAPRSCGAVGTGARSARRSRSPRAGRCTRSWAISSSAWLSTGVPVSARRRPSGGDGARPAGARPACAWPAGSCT